MLFPLKNILQNKNINFLCAGTIICSLYWFIESAMHWFLFDPKPFLVHVLQPDVHEIWMRISVLMVLLLFSFRVHHNITRGRRAELTIIEREEEAAHILEHNPAAILLVDRASGRISYANKNASMMIGMPSSTIVGKTSSRFIDSSTYTCAHLNSDRTGNVSEHELRNVEGRVFPVLKSVTEVRSQDGPLKKIVENGVLDDHEVSKIRLDGVRHYLPFGSYPL